MTEVSLNEGTMKRFEESLHKHLVNHNEKLTFDHLELVKELKCKTKEREDLGLKLYNVQNKVSRQQEILRDLSEHLNKITEKQGEIEKILELTKASACENKKILDEENGVVYNLFHQIEAFNSEVFKLLLARDTLRADVTVLNQAELKLTSEGRKLEKINLKQEDLINHLEGVIDNLRQKIAFHEFHITAANHECEALKKSQHHAQMETEAIELERKNVIKQWHSAVKGLHKRDEFLTSLIQTTIDQQKFIEFTKTEKQKCEKFLFRLKETNNDFIVKLSNYDSTIVSITEAIADCFIQKEALANEILNYQCCIDRVEADVADQMKIKCKMERELLSQENEIQAIINGIKNVTSSLSEQVLDRNSIDVTSQKVLGQIEKIQLDKFAKEKAFANLEGEFIHVNLQIEGYQQTIKILTSELKEEETNLNMNEAIVKDMHYKLQQNISVIEKKITLIHNLQWQLDTSMTHSPDNTYSSSVEIEMRALAKELEEKLLVVNELKQLWSKQQNTLLELSKEKNQNAEEIKELENQLVVFRQRNKHIKANAESIIKENKDLHRKIENWHRQISNLNKLSYDEQTFEDSAMNTIIELKGHILKTFKEHETKVSLKRQTLELLKQEEPSIRENIRQTEEDFNHWQLKLNETRKIKFSAEAEYKEGDIRFLTDRLHKMKVQYSATCQHRGLFVKELERSLNRWDALLTKSGKLAAESKTKVVNSAKSGLERRLEALKKKFKSVEMEIKSISTYKQSLLQTKIEVDKIFHESERSLENLIISKQAILEKIILFSCEKTTSFEDLMLTQKALNFYKNINNSDHRSTTQSEDFIKSQSEIIKQKRKVGKLNQLLEEIDKELKKQCAQSSTGMLSNLEKLKLRLRAYVNYSDITL